MNQQTDASPQNPGLQSGDWLERELAQQATFLSGLSISSDDLSLLSDRPASTTPTVYQLRERTLRRRERRARALSFASSAAVLLTMVGWGIHSFRQQTDSAGLMPAGVEGNLATVTPVSARSAAESQRDAYSDADANAKDYHMVARWWEPVTVEWVDANGRSLGVAGVVAEERMSTLDPAKLSEEQLQLIKAYLSESHHDQARSHFTSSHEPAF